MFWASHGAANINFGRQNVDIAENIQQHPASDVTFDVTFPNALFYKQITKHKLFTCRINQIICQTFNIHMNAC